MCIFKNKWTPASKKFKLNKSKKGKDHFLSFFCKYFSMWHFTTGNTIDKASWIFSITVQSFSHMIGFIWCIMCLTMMQNFKWTAFEKSKVFLDQKTGFQCLSTGSKARVAYYCSNESFMPLSQVDKTAINVLETKRIPCSLQNHIKLLQLLWLSWQLANTVPHHVPDVLYKIHVWRLWWFSYGIDSMVLQERCHYPCSVETEIILHDTKTCPAYSTYGTTIRSSTWSIYLPPVIASSGATKRRLQSPWAMPPTPWCYLPHNGNVLQCRNLKFFLHHASRRSHVLNCCQYRICFYL